MYWLALGVLWSFGDAHQAVLAAVRASPFCASTLGGVGGALGGGYWLALEVLWSFGDAQEVVLATIRASRQ